MWHVDEAFLVIEAQLAALQTVSEGRGSSHDDRDGAPELYVVSKTSCSDFTLPLWVLQSSAEEDMQCSTEKS